MVEQAPFRSVIALGQMIRSGEISPTQLAEWSLERLDSVGRSLNAVVTLTPERALAAAAKAEDELAHGVDRGPLHGIPYGAKDLLAVAGYPTTWGMEPMRKQEFGEDAEVIRRLDEAGAVLVAKLAMVEGAGGFGYEQPDATFSGPGRSAWNPDAWSGGSSSGSGSAVGAGCVPFAIGSETWGSIHVPAAFNGITGFRPTYGRISRRGAMTLSWTMDKIGPLARSSDDCALVYRALAGPDRQEPSTCAQPEPDSRDYRQKGFRFGLLRNWEVGVEPEVAANFKASLAVLEMMGTIEDTDLPDLPFDAAASLIVECEAAAAFEDFIVSGRSMELTAPEDHVGLHAALTIPAVDYLHALRIRRLGCNAFAELFSRFDALVAPTRAGVAMPINERFETWFVGERGPNLGGSGNLCGLPSLSMPNGFGQRGLPTSLELMANAWHEETLFAIGRRFQEDTNWHQAIPGDPA